MRERRRIAARAARAGAAGAAEPPPPWREPTEGPAFLVRKLRPFTAEKRLAAERELAAQARVALEAGVRVAFFEPGADRLVLGGGEEGARAATVGFR
jgi:hypothetical protein